VKVKKKINDKIIEKVKILRSIYFEQEKDNYYVRKYPKLNGDFTLLPVRVNGLEKKMDNV